MCDYEAQASFNFTIDGIDASYLDVNSGGNCEGSCTLNIDIGSVPNIQFVLVECVSTEKVDLDCQITSSSAVACANTDDTLLSLPLLISISVLGVIDVVMLVIIAYRRKVQLEELKT